MQENVLVPILLDILRPILGSPFGAVSVFRFFDQAGAEYICAAAEFYDATGAAHTVNAEFYDQTGTSYPI